MSEEYLPPVIAEILLRTSGFEEGAAKVRTEMETATSGVSGSAAKMSSDVEKEASATAGHMDSMSQRIGKALSSASGSFGPFGSSIEKIGNQMQGLDTQGKALSGTLGEIGRVTTYAGLAAFAAAAYEGVKAAEKFQTSLATIAADSSHGTAQAIGKAFLSTMGSSIYTANDMAASYAQVSQQLRVVEGHTLDASQAMQVMTASSNLAEATNQSLATATSATAQVMQAYHLRVTQASQATDVLYSTSRATDSGIGQIATAMGRLHSRLGMVTPSMKDVGGLMVAAAQTGVTGSRGVMQISAALQHLLGTSASTASELQMLTGKANALTNSSGGFIGMQAAITKLHSAFAGLSPMTQLNAADMLFGASAGQVMLQVIDKGPAAFAKDAAAADRAGSAHLAAAVQARQLAHQLDVLKATLSDLATEFGQLLIPILEKAGHALASVVQWFEKNKLAAEVLAGVISTVLGAAVAVFVGGKLRALIVGVENMAVSFSTAGSKLTSGFIPQLERTGPSITGIGVATQETASTVEAGTEAMTASVSDLGATVATQATAIEESLARVGAAFPVLAETVATSVAEMDGQMSLFADTVMASDTSVTAASGATDTTLAEGGGLGLASRFASGAARALPILAGTGMAAQLTGLNDVTAGRGLGGILRSVASGALIGGGAGAAAGSITGPGALLTGGIGAIAGGGSALITDLLMGGGNKLAGVDSAITKLQSSLHGVASPAQLSTQQLARFYDQAQKILAMPDITAKQRAGLERLSATLGAFYARRAPAATAMGTAQMAERQSGGVSQGALTAALRSAATQGGSEHYRQLQVVSPLREAARLTLESTRVTDETKIAQDAATAQTTIVQDQMTLASDAIQASAKNVTDAASVFSARMSAAATAITDAATVAHDQAALTVTSMSDTTQTQADILGERLLYGYQLLAQRERVQEDILKTGFDRQIGLMQESLDEAKQHWDGKIAAQQIEVARVTQHNDQLVAIAQQQETMVQMHQEALLAAATEKSDTTQLAADLKVALAQNAVTLSASGTAAQKLVAQNALTLAQAQSGAMTAGAGKALEQVTASTGLANAQAAGAYQIAQANATLAENRSQAVLTRYQADASRAEAAGQAALTRLNDRASIAEQRLQDLVTLTQAGGGNRIQSDAQRLTHVGSVGPLALGPDTAYSPNLSRMGGGNGGLTINGGVHISGAGHGKHEIVNDLYLKMRPLLTAPPL